MPEITSAHPDVAVIMSTAVLEPKIIIDCMKLGADDYITKPFTIEDIIQSVDKAIEMKRLARRINSYQKHLEITVDSQKSQIRELFLHSIEALVNALESKDNYTAGHSRRVTALSIAIGKELILPEDVLEDLRWGALLHDVGKIAIDPLIQNKAARLTAEEYKYMMTHSVIGAGIVKPLANPRIVDTIMHHHDRYDGTGIDQQVKGNEIPLGARIVSVPDSFDAITSDRHYHNALPFDLGIEEVKRCQVTQFDPAVVKAFLRIPLPEIVKDFSREN